VTDPLDDLLRDALAAEADRATPSGDAGPALASRARTARRRRSAALLSTAAVVVAVLVAAGVAVVDDGGDGGDAGDISVDTTPPTDPASTTPTSAAPAPTTSSPAETLPSTSPHDVSDQTTPIPGGTVEDEPFYATDAWPLPDPRPGPPEQLVAITEDGRLVVVDTATGAEVRELARRDDPRAPLAADEPVAGRTTIDGLDVPPGGGLVWFSTCCEPISGAPYRVPLDGSAPDERAGGGGYAPDYGASARYVANVTPVGIDIDDPVGDFGLTWWAPDGIAGGLRRVAWSLDGQTVAITYGQEGRLALLDVTRFQGAEASDVIAFDHQEPVVLPGDGWALPSFARDGSLVVAQQTDAGWAHVAIDVATFLTTGELVTSDLFQADHEGIPVSQDHDATGEWLVVVEADDDGVDGGIHWFGPDGRTGRVPGSYRAAAW
jgi:hypothetical protein